MWHLKTVPVPIIMETLGIILKGTNEHINKMPNSPNLYEIQEITLCRTAYLFRLQST